MAKCTHLRKGITIKKLNKMQNGDSCAVSSCTKPCPYLCAHCAKPFCLNHYNHKKTHAIRITVDTLEFYCIECDAFVEGQIVIQAKQLLECKKKDLIAIKQLDESLKINGQLNDSLASVKRGIWPGLSNLGNTCFFNSTLQVISILKTVLSCRSCSGGFIY